MATAILLQANFVNKGRICYDGCFTYNPCRFCVLSGVGLLFLIFFIGTFNYIGYNEGVETGIKSNGETRRGLGEQNIGARPQSERIARNNKSTDDHQDQTQQLQVIRCFVLHSLHL